MSSLTFFVSLFVKIVQSSNNAHDFCEAMYGCVMNVPLLPGPSGIWNWHWESSEYGTSRYTAGTKRVDDIHKLQEHCKIKELQQELCLSSFFLLCSGLDLCVPPKTKTIPLSSLKGQEMSRSAMKQFERKIHQNGITMIWRGFDYDVTIWVVQFETGSLKGLHCSQFLQTQKNRKLQITKMKNVILLHLITIK